MGNLAECLPVTLKYEGGWSDNPKDPGGATMKGITIAVYRKKHPNASKADLRNISQADVQSIYRSGYWEPIRGDDLPDGVALVAFDYAVNSGTGRAKAALAATADIDDPAERVRIICGGRMAFLKRLSTFSTFGKGWTARVKDVQSRGLKMCGVKTKTMALSHEGNAAIATGVSSLGGAAVAYQAGKEAVSVVTDVKQTALDAAGVFGISGNAAMAIGLAVLVVAGCWYIWFRRRKRLIEDLA